MSKQVGECKAMIVRISTARRMKHTHTHTQKKKRRRGRRKWKKKPVHCNVRETKRNESVQSTNKGF